MEEQRKKQTLQNFTSAYGVNNPTLESRNTLRNLSWNYDWELRHNPRNHMESKIYAFQDYIEQKLAKLHKQKNHEENL